MTKLNFPYCNLTHLGYEFGIKIPKQGTSEFSNLNVAVMQVLSTDLKIRSGNNKFDWENPLGPESTEFQKAEAFQNCIRIMREHEVFSHNKILNKASRIQSVDIIDTTIPAKAKPEEINNTLKKTIEAVVGSLEGHKAGFFKLNPGKPEALKQLAELRKLANSDHVDLKKLDDSLKIMEEFRDGSPKYNDYQSNVSILRSLLGELKTSANPLLNTRTETLDGKEQNDLDHAVRLSSRIKSKAAEEESKEESKNPDQPSGSLLLDRSIAFSSEEEQIKAAVRNSLHDKASASKEEPYDSVQVHSSLELYRRKYENTYSDKVRISSDFPILSEALIRETLRDKNTSEATIHANQLNLIGFNNFLKDVKKETLLCPYLEGSANEDSHWKLLQFKKSKWEQEDVVKMTTIDPLGVDHTMKEIPLLNAMAALVGKSRFIFLTEEEKPTIALQSRGNNTECGPLICYIADQIARGVDINAIATPPINLRKEQGQVMAPSNVERLASGTKTRGIDL